MPKSGYMAGFAHGTVLTREMRSFSRGGPRKKLEGNGSQPIEEDPLATIEGRQANPNQKYLVAGKIIEGKDFPEGILPANAKLMSPAHWKHLVEPLPGYLEKFSRSKETLH